MLHWNSWWVRSGDTTPQVEDQPPLLPQDLAEWTPEGWLAWQSKLWNQSWEASLAWWKLYGVAVPVMQWPQLYTPVTIVQDEALPATLMPIEVPMVLEPGSEPPPRARRAASRRGSRAAEPRSSTAQPPPA